MMLLKLTNIQVVLLTQLQTVSVINVDNDGDLLSQPRSSASNSLYTSPSCVNTAATDQNTMLTDDSSLWHKKFTAEEHCAIIRKGPIQVSIEFPQNQGGGGFPVITTASK